MNSPKERRHERERRERTMAFTATPAQRRDEAHISAIAGAQEYTVLLEELAARRRALLVEWARVERATATALEGARAHIHQVSMAGPQVAA